ncbi:MAG: 50S ribosomal protein L21 [Gammaproteobacteria bacterium]
MYAVIKSGGKQYKVAAESTLRVEKLTGDVGASVDLTEVLMVVDGDRVEIGHPILEGVQVEAEITAHGRGPKLRIVKFRRRKHHRKQMGHRQDFTEITIRSIRLAGPPPAGSIPPAL